MKVIGFHFNKIQFATALALLFHVIGLVGILFLDRSFFIYASSINLLLMMGLIFYTQNNINKTFLFFFGLAFIIGLTIEIIGTNTGFLFGNYSYGTVLGPSIKNVPLVIGVNWFIVIYCCGISIHSLLNRILQKLSIATNKPSPILKKVSLIVDGATMAVLFDWLMEPVAIKLGYWKWNVDGTIPFFNYLCWFVISVLFLIIFHRFNFNKENKFAVHLLLIQVMFFLILRTFL